MVTINTKDFQTPQPICEYMADLLPEREIKNIMTASSTVLEPTPGAGQLVETLRKRKFKVIAPPGDFFDCVHNRKYDHIVMNPPFTPMKVSYEILYRCMDLSDSIIALMPWHVLINGEERTKLIMDWGLKSVTHLPRWVFKGSRVQACILQMIKGYIGPTEFKHYKGVKPYGKSN